MRKEYDFGPPKAKRNPYAKRLGKPLTSKQWLDAILERLKRTDPDVIEMLVRTQTPKAKKKAKARPVVPRGR